MHVSEIWRYPVKSMRGERVAGTEVLRSGVAGDRGIVVLSPARNRFVTARTHPGLLGLQGALREDGATTINGLPWQSREAAELVNEAAGERVQLIDLSGDTSRFDILPLLVATDGALDELKLDRRRLRPNIVVAGVAGRAERAWPGHALQMGTIAIDVAQLRMRCVMTTYDPDTLQQDRSVLFRIVREMEGKVALDCAVRTPGYLREGDAVTLAE